MHCKGVLGGCYSCHRSLLWSVCECVCVCESVSVSVSV